MAITPIEPPRAIATPAVGVIAPPAPNGARDGPVRVVVWFHADVAMPDDEIVCSPAAVDALFGDGVAQRLLMTPETAWLGRLLPNGLAAALDESASRVPGDVIGATPYSHIFLLRLSGGSDVNHVGEVIGASRAVALAYPESTISEATPTKYTSSPVFTPNQAYLRAGAGINAVPAWTKGYAGKGVQAGVVDRDTSFSGTLYSPRLVTAGAGSAATAQTTQGPHALYTTGIFACPDNDRIGVGAAPEADLVFSPVKAAGVAGLPEVAAALGAMLANGKLVPGDVVNVSMAVDVGLDVKQAYSGFAALMAQSGTQSWPHRLVTQKIGKDVRPAGVITTAPLEFEPALLKQVADLTAKGVTVVLAGGNGTTVLCEPKSGKPQQYWTSAILGADVGGAWLGSALQADLQTYRSKLATKAAHSLDRSGAKFADGGGILVAGGVVSASAGGIVDNVQLNHGNRIDCYSTIFDAQPLGFVKTGSTANVGGSSLCAPVVAGAAAIAQGIAKAQFKKALRPSLVRALLSDPDLGTATKSGAPVGVMPDLEKLMTFLEAPQGKTDALLKAVQGQQQKSAARVKAGMAGGGFVHDPYTTFTRAPAGASWQPMAFSGDADLFTP